MFIKKEKYNIDDLLEITKILRSENGCPWDKEQDHKSIRMNVLEEAYEVMEAIDSEDKDLLKEELGDLMFQAVFHTELEREQGTFDFDDVCDGICQKLVYRHPHVFSDVSADTTEQVLKNWDNLKSKSKGETKTSDRLDSVPKLLPALMRGEKVGKRAGNVGLDFADTAGVIACLKSEIAELENAVAQGKDSEIEDEFGDVLFSCCSLARFLKKDSEKALTFSINKFIMRFRALESLAEEKGLKISELSPDQQDTLWEQAKKK